jgi:hypothetical protein
MSNPQREMIRAQGEQQTKQQTQQQAIQQMSRPESLARVNDPGFVETLGDPDITDPADPNDDLGGVLKTELSRVNMLAAIDDLEQQRQQILTQNKAEQVKSELVPQKGPGSKCVGDVRRVMAGESSTPTATPDMLRRVDSAVGEEGVRANMLSMAVDGRALDAVTKIQSVAQTDVPSSDRSGGGAIQKAKEFLSFR